MLRHIKIAYGDHIGTKQTAYVKYESGDERTIDQIAKDYLWIRDIKDQAWLLEGSGGKKFGTQIQ